MSSFGVVGRSRDTTSVVGPSLHWRRNGMSGGAHGERESGAMDATAVL